MNWNLNDLVHSPGILGLCKTDWLMMMGGSCPTTWLAAPLVRVASSSPWDWVVALLQGLKGRCDQREANLGWDVGFDTGTVAGCKIEET